MKEKADVNSKVIKDAQMKKLEEMLKKRKSPEDCPYLKTCEELVLENEFKLLCKDQELIREAVTVHMAGHHLWENCPVFVKTKKEKDGKRPSEWK